MLSQILPDHIQLSFLQQTVKIHLLFHLEEHLRAKGTSQCIGREISEGPLGPVNVLKHAIGIVCRADPQIFLIFISPELWKLIHIQVFLYQPFLQFIAHQHMKTVGQLICLGADQTGLYLVDSADKHFSSNAF